MDRINLKPALRKAADIIRGRLLLQVPRKSGQLANSIQVYVKGQEIVVQFAGYGIFTDMGTGPYRVDVADKYNGYRKVEDGVFAQEWTALSDNDYDNIEALIMKEIDKAFQSATPEVIEIEL